MDDQAAEPPTPSPVASKEMEDSTLPPPSPEPSNAPIPYIYRAPSSPPKPKHLQQRRHTLRSSKPIAPYEWTSAKSKPHARIISRKPPMLVGSGSGAMTDVSGLTRYGIYRPPRAVLLGRWPESELDKEGGRYYSKPDETGKYKPHALLLSRPREILVGSGAGRLENVYGWTRFGRANPPRAIIIGRHPEKENQEAGPGAYGYAEPPSRKIGISLKGWPEQVVDECAEPSPGFYSLPPLGKRPGVSLKGRHYTGTQEQSPGPIYDTRELIDTSKGLSMTFKPFPPHEDDVLPGPSHYGRLPGDQAIKETRIQFPSVKFASTRFNSATRFTKDTSSTPGPGPGAFNVADIGKGRGPKALIFSRPRARDEQCGSNRMENLFGKTRFGPAGEKKALIIGRHEEKKKSEPGGGYTGSGGYGERPDKRIGITFKSRLPEIGANRNAGLPGPGSYNLPGFIGKGPAYSIVRKYFHDLGGNERVPAPPQESLECVKELESRAQLDMIDRCIQQVETNRGGSEWDPSAFIPILENLATTC